MYWFIVTVSLAGVGLSRRLPLSHHCLVALSDPFLRFHPFETRAFLLEAIQLHFTEELKSQAAKILGSVDFLGNPLGLFNDISEGVTGLLEGNVGGLFKNLTHGMSNTAAKVSVRERN